MHDAHGFDHYCLTNFKFSVVSRLARLRVFLLETYVFQVSCMVLPHLVKFS